jgi:hypothetical protein
MKLLKQFLLIGLLAGCLTSWCQPGMPKVRYKKGLSSKGYFFLFPYKMRKGDALKGDCAMMVLDGAARVLFYKKINAASDFKLHHNGVMSYFSGDKFYLMNGQFDVIDSVFCQNGVATDSHDFLILPNGHYLLIGTETDTLDWSSKHLFMHRNVAGSRNAAVKFGVVQELDQNKQVVFQWSTRHTHQPEDADPYYLNDSQHIDLTHFNSVDMDETGNIIVSARYFNEVFKIRKSDSSLIWRMGGKKNEIRVLNDSLPFYGQHDARLTGRNQFTLFDNGYSFDSLKHNVRILEYLVDDSSKTATIVWNYSNEDRIVSEATGNAQRLKNGNMLISYGKIEHGTPNITFEVVDYQKATKMIQVYFDDTVGTYRTHYYEELPFTLPQPHLEVKSSGNKRIIRSAESFRFYQWSNGEKTREITTEKSGSYYVFVSDDGEKFWRSETKNVTLP